MAESPSGLTPQSFPTKIDTWLMLVLVFGLLTNFFATAAAVQAGPRTGLVAIAVTFVALTALGLLAVPTRYELHASELVIRSGVVRYRVPYVAIRAVTPSRAPRSAPAWSIDRLRIDYAQRYALVSPADRLGFLHALAARAPQLVLDGEALVLRG